jgi:hypothetical protein
MVEFHMDPLLTRSSLSGVHAAPQSPKSPVWSGRSEGQVGERAEPKPPSVVHSVWPRDFSDEPADSGHIDQPSGGYHHSGEDDASDLGEFAYDAGLLGEHAEEEPYHPDGHEQPEYEELSSGGGLRMAIARHATSILYSIGGLAAVIFLYFFFFSGPSHREQQASIVPPINLGSMENTTKSSDSSSVFSPPNFPMHASAATSRLSPPAGPEASSNTPAPLPSTSGPPALPAEADTTAPSSPVVQASPTSAAIPPDMRAPMPPSLQASATFASATAGAAPPNAAPVAPAAQPSENPQQSGQAIESVTQVASLNAKLDAISGELKALADKVDETRSADSSVDASLSTLDDKLAGIQGTVTALNSRVASAISIAHSSAPIANPVNSAPPHHRSIPGVAASADVNIAQMPVLQGYDLRGVSQDAVVVMTPYGLVTVHLQQQVPGAGTAEGLYQFMPGAGGIELLTSEGLIRPLATAGNS